MSKKSGFDIKSLLNTAKQNSLQSEAAENSEFEIEYISIYDLIPSQDNFYHVDGINELKNSIELFGVQQNLIVSPTEAGKYKIIAGHRRRLACLDLTEEGKKRFEKVPCVVTKEQEYIKEQLLLIHTNSTQRELTDYEKMEQISRVKKLLMQWREKEKVTGRTRDIIADLLDISASQIARMESINNNLIQDFKEWFEKGIINTSVAYEVSGMPEEKQKEFYSMATDQEQITLTDVKQEKKSYVAEKQETKKEVKKETAQDKLTVEVNVKSEAEQEKAQEAETEPLEGQMNVYDYPEYIPQNKKEIPKGLCFTEWIYQRYCKSQYSLIKDMVKHQIGKLSSQSIEDTESDITNAISVWMSDKTKEYQEYLNDSEKG